MKIMLTRLLDKIIVNSLELLQLQPVVSTANNKPFFEYSYCGDGSCSGDCVGGCDGTPAGDYNNCKDGSCSGDCVGGCDGSPAGGF